MLTVLYSESDDSLPTAPSKPRTCIVLDLMKTQKKKRPVGRPWKLATGTSSVFKAIKLVDYSNSSDTKPECSVDTQQRSGTSFKKIHRMY